VMEKPITLLLEPAMVMVETIIVLWAKHKWSCRMARAGWLTLV
jgi:hypothetical protein